MHVGNYITFSSNMELILKLYVNCVMLSTLNFLITFNPGCAVKVGYNACQSSLFEPVSCVFFFIFLLPVLWWIKDVYIKYRIPVTFGQNWPTKQLHSLFAIAKLLVLIFAPTDTQTQTEQTDGQTDRHADRRETIPASLSITIPTIITMQ